MDRELALLSEAMHQAGREALRLSTAGFGYHQGGSLTSHVRRPRGQSHPATACRPPFLTTAGCPRKLADTDARLSRTRVWIVDPIDGTRAFVRGYRNFCLSAALVEGAGRSLPPSSIHRPVNFFSDARAGTSVSSASEPVQPPFCLDRTPARAG